MISSCKYFDLRTKTEKNNSEPRQEKEMKVYQAVICYKDYNVTTVLCKSLEDLTEIIKNYKDYLHYERFEINIEIEENKVKSINYNSLDID